jgi:hypothetical protein
VETEEEEIPKELKEKYSSIVKDLLRAVGYHCDRLEGVPSTLLEELITGMRDAERSMYAIPMPPPYRVAVFEFGFDALISVSFKLASSQEVELFFQLDGYKSRPSIRFPPKIIALSHRCEVILGQLSEWLILFKAHTSMSKSKTATRSITVLRLDILIDDFFRLITSFPDWNSIVSTKGRLRHFPQEHLFRLRRFGFSAHLQRDCDQYLLAADDGKILLGNIQLLELPFALKALECARKRGEEGLQRAIESIDQRLTKLGIKDVSAKRAAMVSYLRDSSRITIHFGAMSPIEDIIADSHFRNFFQIDERTPGFKGPGYQGQRLAAEKLMFCDEYEGADPFSKPKYGSLDFGLDARAATVYGEYIFVLHNELKGRATICYGDSFNRPSVVTFDHLEVVISAMGDLMFQSLLDLSRMRRPAAPSESTYLEVQIHGPIDFSSHVVEVRCPSNVPLAVKESFRQFCHRMNIECICG